MPQFCLIGSVLTRIWPERWTSWKLVVRILTLTNMQFKGRVLSSVFKQKGMTLIKSELIKILNACQDLALFRAKKILHSSHPVFIHHHLINKCFNYTKTWCHVIVLKSTDHKIQPTRYKKRLGRGFDLGHVIKGSFSGHLIKMIRVFTTKIIQNSN